MSGLQLHEKDKIALDATINSEMEAINNDRGKILRDIHFVAFSPLETNDAKRISVTISRFGTLLVALSRLADKQFDENARLQRDNVEVQKRLLSLNRVIVALTIALFFIALLQTVAAFRH